MWKVFEECVADDASQCRQSFPAALPTGFIHSRWISVTDIYFNDRWPVVALITIPRAISDISDMSDISDISAIRWLFVWSIWRWLKRHVMSALCCMSNSWFPRDMSSSSYVVSPWSILVHGTFQVLPWSVDFWALSSSCWVSVVSKWTMQEGSQMSGDMSSIKVVQLPEI